MQEQEVKPQGGEYWLSRGTSDSKLDWAGEQQNWVDGYWQSRNHPHRDLIIKELENVPHFINLLEIGCNCGPNLSRISARWPMTSLVGIDISPEAIAVGTYRVPEATLVQGDLEALSFPNKWFDVVLADAVLMYVSPERILSVMADIGRVALQNVLLLEWDDESELGVVKDYHWARNYEKLLYKIGAVKVDKIKITEEIWPTKTWAKNGFLYVSHLQ
jgi:trans-aconitate methyltransferase